MLGHYYLPTWRNCRSSLQVYSALLGLGLRSPPEQQMRRWFIWKNLRYMTVALLGVMRALQVSWARGANPSDYPAFFSAIAASPTYVGDHGIPLTMLASSESNPAKHPAVNFCLERYLFLKGWRSSSYFRVLSKNLPNTGYRWRRLGSTLFLDSSPNTQPHR